MIKRRKGYPGERFRDMDGKLYQVVAEAVYTGSGEPMVVYQALYGDYAVYVDARTAFYDRMEEKEEEGAAGGMENEEIPKFQKPMRDLLGFLDAKTCREKLNILMGMEKELDEHTLNSIMVSLDLPVTDRDFSERLELVEDYLNTRIRFEDNRLR